MTILNGASAVVAGTDTLRAVDKSPPPAVTEERVMSEQSKQIFRFASFAVSSKKTHTSRVLTKTIAKQTRTVYEVNARVAKHARDGSFGASSYTNNVYNVCTVSFACDVTALLPIYIYIYMRVCVCTINDKKRSGNISCSRATRICGVFFCGGGV